MSVLGTFQLRTPENTQTTIGPKHDKLHMAEGLKYCWCLCARCFLKNTSGQGVCICRECPCQAHYNSRSPM